MTWDEAVEKAKTLLDDAGRVAEQTSAAPVAESDSDTDTDELADLPPVTDEPQ